MPEAAEGHNSALTPAEYKALFMNHYGPIAAQLEIVKEVQAEYKKLRKIAKADKIALWEIDYALKCAEVDDENIIPARIKREAEIAAWFALPVDFQPDMFGSFDREPAEDRARREGRAAGASGKGSNPYDENTAQGRAWADEWASEQKNAREALAAAMDKRNAAKEQEPAATEDGTEVDETDPIAAAAKDAWADTEAVH